MGNRSVWTNVWLRRITPCGATARHRPEASGPPSRGHPRSRGASCLPLAAALHGGPYHCRADSRPRLVARATSAGLSSRVRSVLLNSIDLSADGGRPSSGKRAAAAARRRSPFLLPRKRFMKPFRSIFHLVALFTSLRKLLAHVPYHGLDSQPRSC